MNEFKTFSMDDFRDLALRAIRSTGRWLPHAVLAADFKIISEKADTDEEFVNSCIKATRALYEKWNVVT